MLIQFYATEIPIRALPAIPVCVDFLSDSWYTIALFKQDTFTQSNSSFKKVDYKIISEWKVSINAQAEKLEHIWKAVAWRICYEMAQCKYSYQKGWVAADHRKYQGDTTALID